jgi:hypothetical protein
MRFHGWLPGALLYAQTGLAAYIQTQKCPQTETKDTSPWAIINARAKLAPGLHDSSRLELTVATIQPNWTTCEDVGLDDVRQIASFIEIERVAWTGTEWTQGKLDNHTCNEWMNLGAVVDLYYSYDIAQPETLDSFMIAIELRDQDKNELACVNAPLTPFIGESVTQAATWVPVAIFAAIVFTALWGETRALSAFGGEQSYDVARPEREQGRAHVTRVADCISYLQFIFFSGALTLQYPGFLQAVAGCTSWSTLMLPAGMVARKSWYSGVSDGFYEVNGTLTGSFGMEIMTQTIGGTVTMDTWLNMLALAGGVLGLLVMIVGLGQRLTWTRDWFHGGSSITFSSEGRSSARAIMWTALCLFCSYLLLPLVAWTAYQLDYAAILPLYHTIASAAIISFTVVMICWTMYQSNPRNMGYLLIDDDITEEQQQGTTTQSARNDNIYVAGVFLLLFLRGATIGGLQFIPLAQLLLLLATEVIQISLHAFLFTGASLFSRARLMPAIRTTVLALMCSFLPDTAGHATKLALGFVILTIHTIVLITVFLVPTLFDAYFYGEETASRMFSRDIASLDELGSPQVYGLRDLRRRPTNPTTAVSSDVGSSLRSISPLPPALSTPSPQQPRSPASARASFFREPRRNQSIPNLSRISNSTYNRTELTSSPETPSTESGYSGSREEAELADSPGEATLCEPVPANPDIDYSTREADLYYVRPRRISFGEAPVEQEGKAKSRISSMTNKLRLK